MINDRSIGKYPISVASNLTGVPDHQLRAFEAGGLLEPPRTDGGTRLYSDVDLDRIRKIAELAEKGINYAGIQEVLAITEGNASTDARVEEAEEMTGKDSEGKKP